jgi:IS30 family transposase
LGTFKQLTLEEREQLYLWRNQGVGWREIGRRLKKDHGGLIKEWQRNNLPYLPSSAQERAERKSREQRSRAPLKGMQVWLYVQEHLRKPYFWTPEQIAGRLSMEYPTLRIHHETIYRYIYAPAARRYKLWQYLSLARKKRMKKGGRKVYRGKIIGAVSIDLRPESVLKRVKAGHFETDNIIGKQTDKTALSVTVERFTRFSMVDKLSNRSAKVKRETITKRLRKFPKRLRLTLTTDNGGENAEHQLLTQEIGMQVFFAHAYHSWEKGTVENTNGRIRKFIPKRVSMDQIPEEKIKEIEYWLNTTPRKCLGYLTPYEKMKQIHKYFKYP